MSERLAIAQIRLGSRHRTDLGDIDALAQSIADSGLLHLPVVTTDGELVAGFRRLEAAKRLGWHEVEVRTIDPDDLLLAERDENEVRKDFTPSERKAIKEAIEERIEERRGRPAEEKAGAVEKVGNCPLIPSGIKTRDFAAEKAGFGSEREYRRTATVVDHGVPALVEMMDQGEVSISAASETATLPPAEQAVVVSRGPSAVKEKAREIRAERVASPPVDAAPDPLPGQQSLFEPEPDVAPPDPEAEAERQEAKADKFEARINQIRSFAAILDEIAEHDRNVFRWTKGQKKSLVRSFKAIREKLDKSIRYLEGKA